MPTGAMINAVTIRHTQNAGRIRRNRAFKYAHHCGCRIHDETIRNPEIAKKPSTPASPITWAAGLGGMAAPVMGKECQTMTLIARSRRMALRAFSFGLNRVASVFDDA